MTKPTYPGDVYYRFKMAATYHTGNGNNVLRGWRLRRDSKGYPIRFHFLYTTPDFDLTLRTLPDVGRLPRHKMAAIETGSGNNYWTKWLDPMPTHTRASILTSLRYYRRTLADYRYSWWRPPLPVSLVAWNLVGSVITPIRSGMVENVGAAEIASPSLSVQKLFLLPVSSLPFWIPAVAIVGVYVRCEDC